MAKYYESPTRVCIEFLRSASSNIGGGRMIRLNHSAANIPPQLIGRVEPEMWAQFMQEVEAVAKTHPYVVPPSASRVCEWGVCLAVGAVLCFCCVNPDGGDYGVWTDQVQQLLTRWRDTFRQRGCSLILQSHRDYWIQIDVVQTAMGIPVS